jgi:hypothetical protein
MVYNKKRALIIFVNCKLKDLKYKLIPNVYKILIKKMFIKYKWTQN